jgi:cyanophycinase
VPIGGALKNDNTEVWSRLVVLSGGKGSNWLVFPTASASPEKSARQIMDALEKQGAVAEMVPLSSRLKEQDVAAIVRDPKWLAKVKAAKGVYFAGGAQERITAALYEKDGQRTPMLAAIWQMFGNGGVVAGSSAGAAIMSETMFREPPEILTIMKEGAKRGRDIDQGLGFAGKDLFVDQHFLKRGRIGRMLPVMLQEDIKFGLGVEENSAAVICGDEIDIIGGKGALWVDARNANTDKGLQAFNVTNVMLTYLDRGDKINLKTGVVTIAPVKLSGNKLDPNAANFKPYNNSVRFYPDMLGDTTIVNAMGALLDSPATETRGLAFSPNSRSSSGGNDSSDVGFEFRLFKTKETHGYFTSALGGEDYSVIRMGLDVKPVRLAVPLYVPLTAPRVTSKTGENDALTKLTPQPGNVEKATQK